MKREEMEQELKKYDSTILSFPNRGPWGTSAYRGNCSGWLIAFFIWKYKVKSMAELFAGGGTGYDVCMDMGVPYIGIDLNPNPVRDGIISMDILDKEQELPEGFYSADMVFAHPPYPSIQHVKYANSMWKDKGGELAQRDIQNMSWEDGMKAVNHAVMRGYASMKPGAYEVVLVGDVRRKGQFHSMLQELIIPGQLEQVCVKLQHNTVSGRNTYSNGNFIPLAHEMVVVIKKPSGYEIAFTLPKKYCIDVRDSETSTWKDVVMAVLWKAGKVPVTNKYIYDAVKGHKKADKSHNVEAKIRQTLQQLCASSLVKHVQCGVWSAV